LKKKDGILGFFRQDLVEGTKGWQKKKSQTRLGERKLGALLREYRGKEAKKGLAWGSLKKGEETLREKIEGKNRDREYSKQRRGKRNGITRAGGLTSKLGLQLKNNKCRGEKPN